MEDIVNQSKICIGREMGTTACSIIRVFMLSKGF